MYARPQEISLLKAISYDRNLVQFYGAVLNVEQPMLVRSCASIWARSSVLCQECCVSMLLLCLKGIEHSKYHQLPSPTTAKLQHMSPLLLACRPGSSFCVLQLTETYSCCLCGLSVMLRGVTKRCPQALPLSLTLTIPLLLPLSLPKPDPKP